ncbi:hypothetical protein EVAR_9567_1 [Eumeta japonica]|uniref:Uncharacterized protein n=1 Tax=Eumeta variegata TaxID=151549 RepID=A0A4C1U3N1_EUMVA|nr:hypothetical protein EVAR_9567_1 [Eumeta japonica]
MKVEKDFIKADSANLPKVDSFMIANFFASNPDFCSAEFRNVKTSVLSRQSYGDDTIGYVQLKRDHTLCTVKCRMCPEHKVRQTSYSVSMVIDEKRRNKAHNVQCKQSNAPTCTRMRRAAVYTKFANSDCDGANILKTDDSARSGNYVQALGYAPALTIHLIWANVTRRVRPPRRRAAARRNNKSL